MPTNKQIPIKATIELPSYQDTIVLRIENDLSTETAEELTKRLLKSKTRAVAAVYVEKDGTPHQFLTVITPL